MAQPLVIADIAHVNVTPNGPTKCDLTLKTLAMAPPKHLFLGGSSAIALP